MRYHNITKDDMLNGDGLRVVLWLSGCSHNCPGCQNPLTHNPNDGLIFDEAAKQEIFEQLEKPYISGITFSGGDPLFMGNRAEVLAFMKEIKEKYPDKNIWSYTGYTIEELENGSPEFTKELKQYVDVLVEGRYIESLRDVNLHWRGSSNQRIIDFAKEREIDEIDIER